MSAHPTGGIPSGYPFDDHYVDPVSENGTWSDEDEERKASSIGHDDHADMESLFGGYDEDEPSPGLHMDSPFTQAIDVAIREQLAEPPIYADSPGYANAPTPVTPTRCGHVNDEEEIRQDSDSLNSEYNSANDSWVTAPTPETPCPSRPSRPSRQVQKKVYSEVLEDLTEEGDEDSDEEDEEDEEGAEEDEDGDDGEADEHVNTHEVGGEAEEDDMDAEEEDDPDYVPPVAPSPALTAATSIPDIDAWRAGCRSGPSTEEASNNIRSPIVRSRRSSASRDALENNIESSRAHLRRERRKFERAESRFSGFSDDEDDEVDLIPRQSALNAVGVAIANISRHVFRNPRTKKFDKKPESGRPDTPTGSQGPRNRSDSVVSGFPLPAPGSLAASASKRRSSSPVVGSRRRLTVNTSSANHDVSLPPGSAIVLPCGPASSPAGGAMVPWQQAATGISPMNTALNSLQQGLNSLGVGTPTIPTFGLTATSAPIVNISIQNNFHLAASPIQPVPPPDPFLTGAQDALALFNPLQPGAERAGDEHVIGIQGEDMRVPAHYNPSSQNCVCLPCSVRRAILANPDSAMHLRDARQEHHLMLRTSPAGRTDWRAFANRASGERTLGTWQSFISGLPPHDAIILD